MNINTIINDRFETRARYTEWRMFSVPTALAVVGLSNYFDTLYSCGTNHSGAEALSWGANHYAK
jgi:hypothetical protein